MYGKKTVLYNLELNYKGTIDLHSIPNVFRKKEGEMMESHNTTNKFEFTWKKETGLIIFNQEGIKIPKNLSAAIIEGKISNHIDRKILVEEDGDYFFKFDDEQFYLKSFYNLRTRKYTIKFVGNRKYSLDFGSIVWSKELYFPILQFKNLDSAEYHGMLQILKELNAVNDTRIKEAEDMDHEQHQSKIITRYAYLGGLSALALVFGIIVVYGLHDYERKIIGICNILNTISFICNCLMMFLVDKLVDFKKVRKFYISQYIEAIFVVLVFSIVFAFLLRPN